MIRIALCDDDKKELAALCELLEQYQAAHPATEIRADTYTSAAALLEQLRTNALYDLYILDILMPDCNGIDLGLTIRGIDPGGALFYLSISSDYAVDSYRTKASGYFLKPLKEETLFPALDDVIDQWKWEHNAYTMVKTREGLRRLDFRSVVYGELEGHCICYHLTDGSEIKGMSLRIAFRDAAADFLKDERFALCAASFFVNLFHVEMVEHDGLRLKNGQLLPLSRNLRT
ncbi:MAG: response regulator transcription factor, partial [Firmicutes bacterium]|nr:response regulator transcription factor [Bacillota bacterium]